MMKKMAVEVTGLPGNFNEAKRLFEQAYVTAVLKETAGNVTQAARLSGKERKDFYDLLHRTGIDPEKFRR